MNTRRLVTISILSALAVVLAIIIHFPLIPSAAYLQYDLGDVPILLGTFALGSSAGLAITAVTSILMALFTGLGGPIGAVMHFIASGSLAVTAGLIYHRFHTRKGALGGLAAGTVALTVFMVIANLIITPLYLKVPRPQVIAMIIPVIIPFNLLKGVISSTVTFILYKKLRFLLKPKYSR